MDIKKILLYLLVAMLGTFIWVQWEKDYSPTQKPSRSTASHSTEREFTPPSFRSGKSPTISGSATTDEAVKQPTNQTANKHVFRVKTDIFDIKISAKNGNIINAKLLAYPISYKDKNTPVQILKGSSTSKQIAQSGVTNLGQKDVLFRSDKKRYALLPGEKQLNVTISGQTKSGLHIVKHYAFSRGKYAIKQTITVTNKGRKKWEGNFYHQFIKKVGKKSSIFSRSYTGAAISSPGEVYQKKTFKELGETNISQNIEGGWIALQQPYFLSAWVPKTEIENHYYSKSFGEGTQGATIILGYVSPEKTLFPGKMASNISTLYAGPELENQLNAVAKGLDLTIDYGWLWFLSKPIFWVMSEIHSVVGNWGWSIILVTLLIKLIFYPLSAKSYQSMAKMREVTPRLQTLRERHKDDKQALGRATMEFYKREKVSPVGGCLPMLIQIPVFIALYYVLIESVQLRQAPFILWIHDLSIKDPYYVLPILMGFSMLIQQKLSPPPPDPTQAKMMMLLPAVFTVFFLSFPAGLVLYWLTNNCLSILQQWYVMKTFDSKKAVKKRKK